MVATLEIAEAVALFASQDFDLVDVRDAHEWAAGHIAGTRNLPLDQLRADPDAALPDKDAAIVFVCARGARSLTAAKLAERLGYSRVYNLDGGTAAWTKAGFSLVTDERRAAA